MPSSNNYVFTLNNPTNAESDYLRNCGETNKFKYLILGKEVGANGTPHIQGYVIFGRSKTFEATKKALGTHRVHLEVQKGTDLEASDYCKKGNDYQEWGSLRQPGKRSDLEAFWTYAKDGGSLSLTDLLHERKWFSLIARHRHVIELARAMRPSIPMKNFDDQILRQWQFDLESKLSQPADDRKIVFYLDRVGNCGKTWFTRYYMSKFPNKVQVINCVGKNTDIAYAVDESKSIFLFNVPRGGMEFAAFKVFEQVKDKMLFSPKYNSRLKVWDTNNHVIVFGNESPKGNELSNDRYETVHLISPTESGLAPIREEPNEPGIWEHFVDLSQE